MILHALPVDRRLRLLGIACHAAVMLCTTSISGAGHPSAHRAGVDCVSGRALPSPLLAHNPLPPPPTYGTCPPPPWWAFAYAGTTRPWWVADYQGVPPPPAALSLQPLLWHLVFAYQSAGAGESMPFGQWLVGQGMTDPKLVSIVMWWYYCGG